MKTAAKMFRQAARGAKEGLLGLVYPRACYGCEATMADQDGNLCEDCRSQLIAIKKPLCEICGQAYLGELPTDFECSNCSDRVLHFDFARAAYQSAGIARVLVHRFKYNGHFFLASLLGGMLSEALEDVRISSVSCDVDWILVPVPLHARRLREREFNQADELCRVLAVLRNLQWVNALRRTRYTRRQAILDRSARLKNLRGAFVVSPRTKERRMVEGAHILLVDDVLTTGATASECAQTLYEAGALKVVVITAVRG